MGEDGELGVGTEGPAAAPSSSIGGDITVMLAAGYKDASPPPVSSLGEIQDGEPFSAIVAEADRRMILYCIKEKVRARKEICRTAPHNWGSYHSSQASLLRNSAHS